MTQKEALQLLKMGSNVFVTGPAGSGKTHLINQYIAYLRQHDIDVGITASTGIAATHMGGMTIHSWAGIGIKSNISEYDLEAMHDKQYLLRRIERVKVLIIDEVSMLHHFRLDLVDKVMRSMKRADLPFGGVQVVLCGDFFQLPPVTRMGEQASKFIYKSESWREAGFTVCYLSEQFRQKDDVCITILNEIRAGDVSEESRAHLESRYNKRSENISIEPTKLFTHNLDVDSLNSAELEKLKDTMTEYRMQTKGKDQIVEALKKSCLAPERLYLKVGARVMCLKNNFEKGYVNGTLGVVISCDGGSDPVIRTVSGKRIVLERVSWKIEEDGRTIAELNQYPLRLAWAITVHKSQGMSLDAVEVDLSKSFEPGMGYVALSRVRTLNGLTLLGLNETALEVHEEVRGFDQELRDLSGDALVRLHEMSAKEIAKSEEVFLARSKPSKKEAAMPTHEKTALLINERLDLATIAKEREITIETVISHIEKLVEEHADVHIDYLKYEISSAHWKKIEKAYKEIVAKGEEPKLNPIKNKVGPNISYKTVRLARIFLNTEHQ